MCLTDKLIKNNLIRTDTLKEIHMSCSHFIRSIILTVMSVIIAGCATLPSEPNNTGIVVIPIDQHPSQSSDFFGTYSLNYYLAPVQEKRTGMVTLDPSKNYALIKNLEPGNYRFTGLQFVYDGSGKRGSGSSRGFNIEVKPGMVTFAPEMLRVHLKRRSNGRRTQLKSFQPVDVELVEHIKELLKNEKNSSVWQI